MPAVALSFDMDWKDGRVTRLHITSRKGGKTRVFFNGQSKKISLKANESKQIL